MRSSESIPWDLMRKPYKGSKQNVEEEEKLKDNKFSLFYITCSKTTTLKSMKANKLRLNMPNVYDYNWCLLLRL